MTKDKITKASDALFDAVVDKFLHGKGVKRKINRKSRDTQDDEAEITSLFQRLAQCEDSDSVISWVKAIKRLPKAKLVKAIEEIVNKELDDKAD